MISGEHYVLHMPPVKYFRKRPKIVDISRTHCFWVFSSHARDKLNFDFTSFVSTVLDYMRVAILDIQHELTVEGIERKKVDYTEDELKQLTVTHIAKHYPTPEWVHMYTDGSATPGEGNARAGVYSDIFQQAWPAGKNESNYDGEIKAIREALVRIKEMQIPKTVILSDSKAAIQSIVSKEGR
jgi:hypothetical protein